MKKAFLVKSSIVLLGTMVLAGAESPPGGKAEQPTEIQPPTLAPSGEIPGLRDSDSKRSPTSTPKSPRSDPRDGPQIVTTVSPPAGQRIPSLNDLVLRAVNDMPHGGTYATNATAFAGLRSATSIENYQLLIRPEAAKPNFCSGATYLVFLSVIEKLQRAGRLKLDPQTMEKLQVRSQQDGVGIWGRWNANGPGTARLFYELKLGRNFASYSEAKAGDFVKLFWNDGIGSTERGHSAIFLGLETDRNGQEFVSYWSSNQSEGFGFMRKERFKIKRVLFSRFENPGALPQLGALPQRDDYLAAMLKRPSTPTEMYRMVGVTHPPANPSGSEQVDDVVAVSSAAGNVPSRLSVEANSTDRRSEPTVPPPDTRPPETAGKPATRKLETSTPTPTPTPTPAVKKGFFHWLTSK